MTLTVGEKAIPDRDVLDQEVSILELAIADHSVMPMEETDCEIKLGEVLSLKKDLRDLHLKIKSCSKVPDKQLHKDTFAAISIRISAAQAFLQKLCREYANESLKPVNPVTAPSMAVKLAPIELPTFNGKFEDWASFMDLFESMIHDSTTIPDTQKLAQLKKYVVGDAAVLIKNYTTTNGNYSEAWNALKNRYNNQREIVFTQVRRLFGIMACKQENAASIQTVLDKTNECVSALTVLREPTDKWDTLLIHMTVEKLDNETKRQWALSLKGTDVPKFSELCVFLEHRIRGLHAYNGPSSSNSNKPHVYEKRTNSHVSNKEIASAYQCLHCNGSHYLYKCPKFLAMTVKDRLHVASSKRWCFKCLRPGSKTHYAETCQSQYGCRTCEQNHHSLLHLQQTPPPKNDDKKQQASNTKSCHVRDGNENTDVLLSTAVVNIHDINGYDQDARIMLDTGSQANLVSESFVKRHGLKRSWDRTKVTGVGGKEAGYSKGKCTITLYSKVYNEEVKVVALILPEVTDDMPQYPVKNNYDHLAGIALADPKYYEPSPIDILVGNEHTADIFLDTTIKGKDASSPSALNTKFGWVLAGRVEVKHSKSHKVRVSVCGIENILEKYFDQETVQAPKHMTVEEKECEEQFVETYKRDIDGRFCVTLPFNNKLEKLGASRDMAVRRWKAVEKRLARNPSHAVEYHKFMREYLDLGHMAYIPRREVSNTSYEYYLPHHFVEKSDSTTTKLRVVFDGSAKSTSGMSLNDCLKVGATVQDDIFTLLLRFRQHPIALKADIAKMFRQFRVKDEHCDFQRIVWREKITDEVKDYKLLTVTYGTACAPFLATRCLVELAKLNSDRYPVAAIKLQLDAYVDDLMSGAETVEEAISLIKELNKIVESAGMCFRKWISSNAEVFQSIPEDLRESMTTLSLDKDANVKALGVQWHAFEDYFSFTKPECEVNSNITKRNVLSQLARVYDPLGLLSPVTINAKLFMQQLWKCKLGWDDTLSEQSCQMWSAYQEQLKSIDLIQIPRWVKVEETVQLELHGFSDASEKAYGAVVYLRCTDSRNKHSVKMLASKSRVASLKTVTLPRLELNGTLLLSELSESVKISLNLQCDTYGWTDSMIVLHWLASHPGRWQTFVANRVSKIQELLPFECWNHVKSEENPADLVSRVVTATSLSESSLWWNGPQWLSTNDIPEKIVKVKEHVSGMSAKLLEEKTIKIKTAHVQIGDEFMQRFSQFSRLRRSTAFMLRWASCRKGQKVLHGPLTVVELENALNRLVLIVQQKAFPNEYEKLATHLDTGKPYKLSAKSKLISLRPIMDPVSRLIRVGGRNKHANIPENRKHPIILPHNFHLTTLLIRHAHLTNWHGSNKLVWRNLIQKFWIIRARTTIQNILRKCVRCRRFHAKAMSQVMSDLPSSRVNIGGAFEETGVDYAGPFKLRIISGRSNVERKCYMCIFVCLKTKAVHIEAASGMSTKTFLDALDRFVSRRGFPNTIKSDCGTNFVGADRELQQFLCSDQHNIGVANKSSELGINWEFNTPSAPHHGGIWEAAVKSAKCHIRKVIGDTPLNFEEFQTVFSKVEACLNSRPICAMTADPDDLDVLTPGHFLIQRPMKAITITDFTEEKVNRLTRWERLQQIQQQFWRRWQVEYLSTLQQRWKWKTEGRNIAVGDLCVLLEEKVSPTKWKLVRVTATKPGHDNIVRSVTVKSDDGIYDRPIVKLSPILFINEQE